MLANNKQEQGGDLPNGVEYARSPIKANPMTISQSKSARPNSPTFLWDS